MCYINNIHKVHRFIIINKKVFTSTVILRLKFCYWADYMQYMYLKFKQKTFCFKRNKNLMFLADIINKYIIINFEKYKWPKLKVTESKMFVKLWRSIENVELINGKVRETLGKSENDLNFCRKCNRQKIVIRKWSEVNMWYINGQWLKNLPTGVTIVDCSGFW